MLPLRKVLALPVVFVSAPVIVMSCAGSGDSGASSDDGGGDVSILEGGHDAKKDGPLDRFVPPQDTGPDVLDETGDDTTGDDGGVMNPLIRVAHFVPDLGPLDFCFVPMQGMPIGPLLAANALPSGMGYSQVSAYFGIPTGSYKVRLVKPFMNDCTKTLGLTDGDAMLADGSQNTLILAGMSGTDAGVQPYQVVELTDDTFGSGNVLRFVNLMPDTPSVAFVDTDVNNGSVPSLVFGNIPYPAPPMAGSYTFNQFYTVTVDSNGYGTFNMLNNPLSPPVYINLGPTDAGATKTFVTSAMPNFGSGPQTAFIGGLAAEKPKVPEVVICSDSSGGGSGALSTCHLMQ